MGDQVNQRIYLLENANATGEYVRYERDRGNSTQTPWCQLIVFGTFDGATVTFTFRPADSVEDIPIYDGAAELFVDATTRQIFPLEIPDGEEIRAVIANPGIGTSITAYLAELRVT